MQTMPNKTRNAVAVGAVLLALVGGFALWSGSRGDSGTQEQVENPATLPGSENAAAGTNPAGSTDTDTASGTEDEVAPASSTNVTSPAATANGETAAAKEVPLTHTVKEGETLRTIAKQYYGDMIYSADIETLNEIDNPNHITVGQNLELPRPEELKKSDQ